MKTISKLLMLLSKIILHLQPHFSVALLISNKFNTNAATRVPIPSYGPTSKFSFKKNLKAYKFLLTVFEVNLEKSHYIS